MIKQSKYHIIIEPNTNSFDKYLIQEIIHEYAKSELLNILKYNKLFKIIIINKIDNLSYYIQSALRRTMEKYSNICKFILISNQLSKVIEPLRSRCLLIRIPLATNLQILESILYISYKENYSLTSNQISTIINKSDNIINKTIWLFDLYKYNITYNNNWNDVIDNIINLLCKPMIHNKDLLLILKKIRENFYLLFITNIPTQTIIKQIMNKLLKIDIISNDLNIQYNIIYITSIFEQRLINGTRHIIQFEAYIIRLLYLLYFKNNL